MWRNIVHITLHTKYGIVSLAKFHKKIQNHPGITISTNTGSAQQQQPDEWQQEFPGMPGPDLAISGTSCNSNTGNTMEVSGSAQAI